MRMSGIGSGHTSDVHQVTECMHDHAHVKKEGSMSAGASQGGEMQPRQTEGFQEGYLSLSAWMEKMVGNGRRLLRSIWGSSETAQPGEAGERTGTPQVLADIRDESMAEGIGANVAGDGSRRQDEAMAAGQPRTGQIAAAATAVVQPETIQENPYFSPAENIGGRRDTVWQKMRVRFRDMAGQLAGHLPGKFSGFFQTKNSFQAKQEAPKKDLRKHSRFRKDEVEIDCVLTDDSYLLDSYDRKGEYSRLSTKK